MFWNDDDFYYIVMYQVNPRVFVCDENQLNIGPTVIRSRYFPYWKNINTKVKIIKENKNKYYFTIICSTPH